MEIFTFFTAISPILLILRISTGNVFASASRTSGPTAKRRPPFDSARRNGLFTCSREVMTGAEGVSGWGFKNGRIGNVFASASRTSGRTAKRRPPFDSARRNGLLTCSREVLTVDEGVSGWGFKNGRIGNVFASASRTSGRTAKRRPPFDSAHRHGLFTCSREVLTVDEGVSGWGFKNGRIGNVFASASRSSGRTGKR